MNEMQIKSNQLAQYQGMPLSAKIKLSEKRIREWYEAFDGKVFVAYSGGKDSTVLLHLVRSIYPDVPAVFCNTGQELVSILKHVEETKDVTVIHPKEGFDEIVKNHGYPVVSKMVCRATNDLKKPIEVNAKTQHVRRTGITSTGRLAPSQKMPKKWMKLVDAPFKVTSKCCNTLKIQPTMPYRKETGRSSFVGVMADESRLRRESYLNHGGCNAFEQKDQQSRPIMFWKDTDILEYLATKNVPYAECYGDIVKDEKGELTTTGEKRTGCKFCLFGVHLEKGENRIQRLARTEPESYKYAIEELGYAEVMDYIGVDWKPIEKKEQLDMFTENKGDEDE